MDIEHPLADFVPFFGRMAGTGEQPLSGGSAFRQLTHFSSERIARFEFSADGSQIAIQRAHTESDAVLLRDEGKAK